MVAVWTLHHDSVDDHDVDDLAGCAAHLRLSARLDPEQQQAIL